MTTILLLNFANVLVAILAIRRVNQVYAERIRVLDKISQLGSQDIKNGDDWRWRYDAYESVGFWEMSFKFRNNILDRPTVR